MFPVDKWTKARGMEYDKPQDIYLGVGKDGAGRTMFGVCEDRGLGTAPIRITWMANIVDDTFAEVTLAGAKATGWFVFHTGTQLKVPARELEVAFYRLGLIDHMGAHLVETPALGKPSPTTPPDQVLVNAKDLEDVLDTFTKGQAAQEGDPLARLRRVVWEHTAAKARQSMTEKVQGEGTA
jgi:hypothetical protein